MKSVSLVLGCLIVTAPVLLAQPVNDGATNTLSNSTNTITGGVTVGTNGSFTLLVVSNNALLTNTTFGSIGANATAKSNEVRLLAPTARWRMGGNLFAGSNGAFSRLVVSNGATLEDFDGVLANGAASSNNSALVTGSGSVWSNRGDLTIGFSGKENQLLITNGGRVVNRFSYLGRQPGSSNNLARITGAGSVWSNLFDVFLGQNDRSNRLIIEAGGTVSCANGVISGSSSAGNCEVLVTGLGSLWSNRFFLSIGDVSGRNLLVVSNGAKVVAGGSILGNLSPAMSNQVLVTGLGSLWTNESSLSLGGGSGGNRADAAAGGWLACVEGLVGENASSHSNTVVLSDSGSGWNVLERLTLGKNGSTNVLIANNGATILSSNATIGANVAFGSNNLALLIGAGTLWSNRNEFLVGSNGSYNRLVVSNAAHVFVGTNVFVGFSAFSSNNTVLVTGTGSTLSSVNNVIVGQVGSGNRLVLSNGASINSQSLYLGINSASSNNETIITSPGSIWTAPEWGLGSGRGNRLLVNGGGQVRGTSANVGAFGLAGDNLATLTDPGSSWTNLGEFYVGLGDSRNSLVVSNGGLLFTESMTVGRDSSSLSNRITVAGGTMLVANGTGTGVLDVRRGTTFLTSGLIDVDQLVITNPAGAFDLDGGTLISRGAFVTNGSAFTVGYAIPSVWDVRSGASNHVLTGELDVGYYASFSRLFVTNSARLTNGLGFIGFKFGANSNVALISGSGSEWATASLSVGQGGSFNQLVVSNAATVSGGDGNIGYEATGSNNLALVSGAGSLWTNLGEMYIGYMGTGNQLVVSNGGTVSAQFNRNIGYLAVSRSNSVVVTDPGSRWLGDDSLYVGTVGSFNQMLVSNGGKVTSGIGGVGSSASASNNMAIVTGAGSSWTNQLEMVVGDAGSANSLVVSNGATVLTDDDKVLGYGVNARSNTAVVTGPGSAWFGNGNLFVGSSGYASSLVVTNGGLMVSSNGILGAFATALNNTATIVGAGSRWLMSGDLYASSNGGFSTLMVSDGGLVANSNAFIGFNAGSVGNQAIISGPGTVWSNQNFLFVGQSGNGNRLTVSEAARVECRAGSIGIFVSASNNQAVVDGPGSFWRMESGINIGTAGAGNRLLLTNGGRMRTFAAASNIGANASGASNEVVITGPGSSWTNGVTLTVGNAGSGNRLVITNGGEFRNDSSGVILGATSQSTNNRIVVDGGTLRTLGSSGVLDIRRGTNVFNAGLIDARQLLITNALGRFEFNGGTLITRGATVSNGLPLIIGRTGTTPAVWDVRAGPSPHVVSDSIVVGESVPFCQLLVTNGGMLICEEVDMGDSTSHSNQVTIAGPGSRVEALGEFYVGNFGSANSLVISNSGRLDVIWSELGFQTGSSNNQALVTGSGSLWTSQDYLAVGQAGKASRALLADGATVIASNLVTIGTMPVTSSNNLLQIANGILLVTNAAASGTLDVRNGTNRFDAGLIQVDRLRLTNAPGKFEFNGGTLSVGSSTVSNGQLFRVGNGANAATFSLAGNGTHSFSNGIVVSSNAMLTGNGIVSGPLTVSSGSQFSPGSSIGKIVLSNSPALLGTTLMEIFKNGAVLTNDQIQVAAPLMFGGALIVTNVGPSPLAAGDRFQLFSASAFAGAFSSIILPPIPPGLIWTNKLVLDGSLEVAPLIVQPVSLTIQRSNNFLIVSWPIGAADFCLETSFDLKPPVAWQTVGNGITTNGGSFVFSVPITSSSAKQFFHLAFPCSPAPVALSIQLSNKLVTVSWPSNAFRLETTFNLAPPVSWQAISNGINNAGQARTFTFTNDSTVTNQFFRLAYP